jgi:CDP-ribitol ribitolphosphotransferase
MSRDRGYHPPVQSTMTAGASATTRPADPALEIVSLHWERVQVVIRARRGPFDLALGRQLRLERLDGDDPAMPPTRAWLEVDDLLLRFNVMQGPGQDPLRTGHWTLTIGDADGRGRGTPVRITDPRVVDPARDAGIFEIERDDTRGDPPFHFRFVPRIDPTTGSLSLDVELEPADRPVSARQRRRQRRVRVIRALRAIRPTVFRGLVSVVRIVARRNGRRILFTSDSRADLSGNLALVHDRMVARRLDRDYDLLTLFKPSIAEGRSIRDRLRMPWLLARADVVVIDDYQPVIYRVDFDRDVKIVQLWHASGPFKTVGYSRIGREGGPGPWSRIHKNYTHAIVSSEDDVPYYAEAFGIPESRVVPTGIPRMDRFFDDAARVAARAAALEAFPMIRDRTTILFAPTFRGEGPRDASYDPAWIDYAALFALATEKDAVVILRMHPFIRRPLDIPAAYAERLIDGSGSSIDVNDLLFSVDLLVTDYSSIVFEYSLLGRPMLFYAPDLEEYLASRDVYEPFETFVPGRIVRTSDALLDAIRREDYQVEKVAAFAERHFAHLDGSSTDRVIDEVILAR